MKKIIFTKTFSSNIFLSLENDILNDICIRETDKLNIGDIYLGRVVSIKEDINSAFISLESGRTGFIRCKDLITREDKTEFAAKGIKIRDVRIKDLISVGQDILVQISREATGSKNPMMVKEISLSNKFMALLIEPGNVFYSKKIKSFSEKKKLKDFAADNDISSKYSVIFRRQSLNVSEDVLLKAYHTLADQMNMIIEKSIYTMAPKKLYDAKEFIVEMLESHAKDNVDVIYVENIESKKIVDKYLYDFGEYIGNPKIIDDYCDLYNLFSVSLHLESLMNTNIILEYGGDICIEKTEAMTVVDVNSKGFSTNESGMEPAWYINLSALKEIERQLRLRDIGGIIIVDFVNFKNAENEDKFLDVIKNMFRDSEVKVEGFTRLGLLELTRKRTTNGLLDKLFVKCRTCNGKGKIASKELLKMKLENMIYTWKLNKSAKIVNIHLDKEESEFIVKHMSEELSDLEHANEVKLNFI